MSSQELLHHLRVYTPLIWVRTNEPDRVIEQVQSQLSNDLFLVKSIRGLCRWNASQSQWKTVLIPDPASGEENAIFHPNYALDYVIRHKGTLIIPNAHEFADKTVGVLSDLYSDYRQAYRNDDLSMVPARVIMLSVKEDVPPEIAASCAFIDYPLMGADEIASEFELYSNSIKGINSVFADSQSNRKATLAARGLAEQQLNAIAMNQVQGDGRIDPKAVDDYRKDRVRHGGVLEVRRPVKDLSEIGGLDEAKRLINGVKKIWDSDEGHKHNPIRRFLLVGVSGSGKSAICEATAKTLDLDFAKFSVSQAMSKWVGESEANMRSAFRQIEALQPLVVWMDEAGRDLSVGQYADGGTTQRVHAEFLTGMQELPPNVLLMAAANRIQDLSPEMLRSGRFDKIMFVGFPTAAEREAIFGIHLRDVQIPDVDIAELSSRTETFTGAEIEALIRETSTNALIDDLQLSQRLLLDTIPSMHNRVWLRHRQEIVEMYQVALEEWSWASSEQCLEASNYIAQTVGDNTMPTESTIAARQQQYGL